MQHNIINAGDIVYASSVKAGRDGSYILNINGRNVEAFSKDLLYGSNLKLMILKINPLELVLKDIDFAAFVPYFIEKSNQVFG